MPFLPVLGYQGSDYLKVRPDLKTVTDPYTGAEYVAAPPIKPDLCLVHGLAGDEAGNVLLPLNSDADLAAKAARQTIVSVEEKVPDLDRAAWPRTKRLAWPFVSALVLDPGGARPLACPGRYPAEPAALKAYLQAFKEGRAAGHLSALVQPGGAS